jgi:micrococcal nuclease
MPQASQASRLSTRLWERSHPPDSRLDKYKRTLADVLLPDGTNANHTLVKEGWCWWYRKYAPGNMLLEELEIRARTSGIGLWADPRPVPPWEWRKRK